MKLPLRVLQRTSDQPITADWEAHHFFFFLSTVVIKWTCFTRQSLRLGQLLGRG